MENSKLLIILAEVDEGTKTPFKAHNEILSLFGVVGQSEQCCEPLPKEGFYLGTTCPKCNKPFRNVWCEQYCLQRISIRTVRN